MTDNKTVVCVGSMMGDDNLKPTTNDNETAQEKLPRRSQRKGYLKNL